MPNQDIVSINLPSGALVRMSRDAHDNHYLNFTNSQFLSFNNLINGGTYFPQIMQFIMVLISIFNGITGWREIVLLNVFYGAFFTIGWYWLRLYKIPALAFFSCLIGGNIFRYFLHIVVIAIIAFFVLDNWVILVACIAGGIISTIIDCVVLYAMLSTIRYNDRVVKYVSTFRYKE